MNSFDIMVEDDSNRERIDVEHVESFLSRICDDLGLENVNLSLTFADDEEIRRLNREFRDKDEPTDILSFVADDAMTDVEDDFVWPEMEDEEENFLGDLVISLDSLERNCHYFNVTSDEELDRLLVHGMLHLTGMDHKTNDLSEPMLQKQEEMLGRLRG